MIYSFFILNHIISNCNILSHHSPYHKKFRLTDRRKDRQDQKHVHAERNTFNSMKKVLILIPLTKIQ